MNVFKTVQNLSGREKRQHCPHSSFTEPQRGSGVKERWLRSFSEEFASRAGAGRPGSAVIVAPTVGVRLNAKNGC